jgi:signal transduction histidine kinase
MMLAELDIQGYHDKADGPEQLLVWVEVGLKAYRLIQGLKERERLQADLVANVSHEFRTPLHIITGYIELMRDGQFGVLTREAVATLDRIEEAGRSLAELVADFLKYARVQAGVEGVSRHEVVTCDLVEELRRLAGVLLEEKDVVFDVVLEDAPPVFLSDPIKLRTILRNLITNAAKFTSAGSVCLAVRGESGRVRFVVEDTGPGIRGEDHELIFEPFRQVDGSSTRSFGGIGLGLALSRKLARLLGGDIELDSRLGRGATFTVVLPLLEALGVSRPEAALPGRPAAESRAV